VSGRPTLESRIARWFAATFVLLYGVVAGGLWLTSRERGRDFALLSLKTEAESVALYVATTGRLDPPELTEAEAHPFPIWIRVSDGRAVVASTPGAPQVPTGAPIGTDEARYQRASPAAEPYLVMRHLVGGGVRRDGRPLAVEAIGDLSSLRAGERRLGALLALLGVVVIPLATRGGRTLARRALQPIAGLVEEIRRLEPAHLEQRLTTPDGAVEEVAVLARGFNETLDRLEQSSVATRRFAADASHEIRNPLSVIRTGLEVALRRDRPPDEYRALLRENLEEIVHLQATLDGLLEVARATPAGGAPAQRERVDFSRLVAEALERFRAVAAERSVALTPDIAPALAVDGDPRLLRLLPFNLIDNALKHGPTGGGVRVEAGVDAEGVVLRVASDGAPVPPELRERIFERYVRGGATRADIGGLGLAVVRRVAEAHGGAVRRLDTRQGNCFEVRLPAAGAAPAAQPAATASPD